MTSQEHFERIEAVMMKMAELGPQKRQALRKWITATFSVGDQQAYNYINAAKQRIVYLSGRTAKDHVAEMTSALDAIIYSKAKDSDKVKAVQVKANILGVWHHTHSIPLVPMLARIGDFKELNENNPIATCELLESKVSDDNAPEAPSAPCYRSIGNPEAS